MPSARLGRLRRFLAVASIAGIAACSGGGGSPSTPSTSTPTPASTPAPAPTPTPNPFAAACGSPLPAFADSYGFGIKVQTEPTKNKKVLNASPLVLNNAYCQAVGFGNFKFCNTRPESSPQRAACDHYLSGISDSGRVGPNWFKAEVDGRLLKCGGVGVQGDTADCRLNDTNQYLLDVFAG